MERVRGVERERMLRVSRGPVMSRSWKPGKRTMAICFGVGDAIVAVYAVGVACVLARWSGRGVVVLVGVLWLL
jgi:uncharacterized protein with WD repeat